MGEPHQRIWIEAGDECPYFYEESELTEAGSPVTEYIRADLCHRPAPAATDTGLETVGYVTPEWLAKHCSSHTINSNPSPAWTEAVVTRSQAEAIIRDLETKILEAAISDRLDDAGSPLSWQECAEIAEGIISDLKADIAAKDARIKAMEEERASLVEKMGMQISAQLARAEKAEAKLAAAEKAAKSVEQWWLSEGMKHFDGAPYCIFATRAVLGGQKRPWEFKDDEHDL